MRQKTVKIIAAIIALILVLAMVFQFVLVFASAATQKQKEIENELAGLKNQMQDLTSARSAASANLTKVRNEMASALTVKKALDNEISFCEQQLAVTEQMIDYYNQGIALKEEEVAEAEQIESEAYELFKSRVRATEESGEANYLGVILRADSISDMLGRVDDVQHILDYNKELLAKLKLAKEAVEAARDDLKACLSEQETIKEDYETQIAELNQKYQEQAEMIAALEKNEAEYEKAYNEALAAEKAANDEIKDLLAALEKEKAKAYVGGVYAWPTPGYYKITDEFGQRIHPILKKPSFHTGVDIAAPSGTAILAANAGDVIVAKYNSAYGNYVVIDHGGGQTTLYAHMSKMLVKVGDTVKKGGTIGKVGSTGYSTGAHLHFEIRINGTAVDPMKYFR